MNASVLMMACFILSAAGFSAVSVVFSERLIKVFVKSKAAFSLVCCVLGIAVGAGSFLAMVNF